MNMWWSGRIFLMKTSFCSVWCLFPTHFVELYTIDVDNKTFKEQKWIFWLCCPTLYLPSLHQIFIHIHHSFGQPGLIVTKSVLAFLKIYVTTSDSHQNSKLNFNFSLFGCKNELLFDFLKGESVFSTWHTGATTKWFIHKVSSCTQIVQWATVFHRKSPYGHCLRDLFFYRIVEVGVTAYYLSYEVVSVSVVCPNCLESELFHPSIYSSFTCEHKGLKHNFLVATFSIGTKNESGKKRRWHLAILKWVDEIILSSRFYT